jgi:hypothetical protein
MYVCMYKYIIEKFRENIFEVEKHILHILSVCL